MYVSTVDREIFTSEIIRVKIFHGVIFSQLALRIF